VFRLAQHKARPYLKNMQHKKRAGSFQMVEFLFNKPEALSLTLSTDPIKKTEKRRTPPQPHTHTPENLKRS
jgi:hypothetical protein